jgi:hypothetical protein
MLTKLFDLIKFVTPLLLEWAKFAKKLELRKYMNVGFCFVFGSTGV